MESQENTDLLLNVIRLQANLQRKLDCSLQVHGISTTEYQVLALLQSSQTGCMRRVDLAAGIGLTASAVTRLLAPMEKIGLVRKQAGARDARVSLVALTQAGQRIQSEALATVAMCADRVFMGLKGKDSDHLARITESLSGV